MYDDKGGLSVEFDAPAMFDYEVLPSASPQTDPYSTDQSGTLLAEAKGRWTHCDVFFSGTDDGTNGWLNGQFGSGMFFDVWLLIPGGDKTLLARINARTVFGNYNPPVGGSPATFAGKLVSVRGQVGEGFAVTTSTGGPLVPMGRMRMIVWGEQGGTPEATPNTEPSDNVFAIALPQRQSYQMVWNDAEFGWDRMRQPAGGGASVPLGDTTAVLPTTSAAALSVAAQYIYDPGGAGGWVPALQAGDGALASFKGVLQTALRAEYNHGGVFVLDGQVATIGATPESALLTHPQPSSETNTAWKYVYILNSNGASFPKASCKTTPGVLRKAFCKLGPLVATGTYFLQLGDYAGGAPADGVWTHVGAGGFVGMIRPMTHVLGTADYFEIDYTECGVPCTLGLAVVVSTTAYTNTMAVQPDIDVSVLYF